ncbi:MAG TPA: hypothetical protein EYQ24_12210 [Bacteroidetes bacterium]|nr:hypothetical protein [Bacteroidota bacterium]HIL58745.1 hypothetical protein [Rhodothermales bacterium]
MPVPPHLRSLPRQLADALDDEQRRELAEIHTERDREARERDARGWANVDGLDALPEFLREIEREHPRTADLWMKVRPGSTLADVREVGARLGLSVESVDLALTALRRAELVTVSGTGDGALVTTQAPASLPF